MYLSLQSISLFTNYTSVCHEILCLLLTFNGNVEPGHSEALSRTYTQQPRTDQTTYFQHIRFSTGTARQAVASQASDCVQELARQRQKPD